MAKPQNFTSGKTLVRQQAHPLKDRVESALQIPIMNFL
jgi:hypothetical protein